MDNKELLPELKKRLKAAKISVNSEDALFYNRLVCGIESIQQLYLEIYSDHKQGLALFPDLVNTIIQAYSERSELLRARDLEKSGNENWFLSNRLAGMSLYVDRFNGNLPGLGKRLDYLEELGINLLHLMPIFQSPQGESDGGYAVSDFTAIDEHFGSMSDLLSLQNQMASKGMYLMLDIVLNHTSHRHEWAMKAKQGDETFQDYYYMFNSRAIPDEYEKTMPEVFPESSPGNFTYVPECDKWVMTVFHNYQWDLNYTNPAVFLEMLATIFFYANLGVDILRIDAPAFIWKQSGTSCQNLPQAHLLLSLIKQCVAVASPGMALLGEAIVAPAEILKYYGTGPFTGKECDLTYNATQMALQWDMLATGDTKVMLEAQYELQRKPYGTSWITYTRCHDDIGLGYEDYMIRNAGYEPYAHRKFLMEYYSGKYPGSNATGALFSSNTHTGDARISGSLASLCGLEKAMNDNDKNAVEIAIKKILLMQAHSFFLGGIPMLFYGDEAAYTNDYSYLKDPAKSYDNRWMHRPVIDWNKNKLVHKKGTIENLVFCGTQQLLNIRKSLKLFSDYNNIKWFNTGNNHIALYSRALKSRELFCVFNFSGEETNFNVDMLFDHNHLPSPKLFDYRSKDYLTSDNAMLNISGFGFYLVEIS